MRSGLQPVAISCNNNSYHERIAPPVDARARPQNASAASHVLRKPISMQDYEFPTIGVLGSSCLAFCYKLPKRLISNSPKGGIRCLRHTRFPGRFPDAFSSESTSNTSTARFGVHRRRPPVLTSKPGFASPDYRLGAVRDFHLGEDARNVVAHGLGAEVKTGGYGVVGVTLGH
jgi:hypothetical protein